VPDVGSWYDIRLRDILHVFIFGIHVIDVARWVAATVLGEVTHFSAVEAWSFRAWSLIVGLSLNVHGVVVFRLDRVHVDVVTLVLVSVVCSPGPRQVHWYLDIVICGLWCIGGIILRLLLLLLLLRPLLVLLGASSPGLQPELILVLPECVVESSWIGDSLSGSDEFDHLSSLGDVDHPGLIFIVVLWERNSDNFFQYAWR
jgi:hypothetical protein